MEAIDHFPLPEGNYDSEKFRRNFLLMDAALGAVECEIEYAQRFGITNEMATAFSEGKRMITYMLQYVAHAYYASGGRVKESTVFTDFELNFPYKPPELWDIVTNKKAPRHDDAEPESNGIEGIARAITMRLEEEDI